MEQGRRSFLRTTAGVGTAGLLGLAGCTGAGDGEGNGDETATATPTIRAAFVNLFSGSSGWVAGHHASQERLRKNNDWIDIQQVPETAVADAEQVFRELAESDFDAVFGNAFDYNETLVNIAPEFPDVAWFNTSGLDRAENLSVYEARNYHAAYLCGYAGGLLTETDVLGMVSAFPIPKTLRILNCYALGGAAANPDVEVEVNWSGAWFDPEVERQATRVIIDNGADVVAQWSDSAAVVKEANEQDVWAVSAQVPHREAAGDNYLNGIIANWDDYYETQLKEVRDGTWEASFDWWGLDTGIVDIGEWGPNVPEGVQNEVEGLREEIIDGNLDVWKGSKFEGKDDDFLYQNIDSYVDQVRGKVPK